MFRNEIDPQIVIYTEKMCQRYIYSDFGIRSIQIIPGIIDPLNKDNIDNSCPLSLYN